MLCLVIRLCHDLLNVISGTLGTTTDKPLRSADSADQMRVANAERLFH